MWTNNQKPIKLKLNKLWLSFDKRAQLDLRLTKEALLFLFLETAGFMNKNASLFKKDCQEKSFQYKYRFGYQYSCLALWQGRVEL